MSFVVVGLLYRLHASGARHTVFLDSPCSWRPPGASPFRKLPDTVQCVSRRRAIGPWPPISARSR